MSLIKEISQGLIKRYVSAAKVDASGKIMQGEYDRYAKVNDPDFNERGRQMAKKGYKRNYSAMMAAQKIKESLGSKATAEDYIDDFVHSSNSKFDGDSKKQRIRRALAAFYNKKK